MTISTLASSIQVAGNSSRTAFQFPFVGDSASDIIVSSVGTNGSITLLSPTTYSISLNAPSANQLWGIGGTVLYPLSGSPLPTGQSLIIARILPFSQQITTQNQGNYYSQVTEQALDTLAMQIQQLAARTTQFRGIWLTGTLYYAGDIVQDGANGNNTNNYYICAIQNTAGTWVTDLAAGDWTISALAAIPTGQLTLTGDITGAGTSPIATTLATVNSNVGTFSNATVQVDAKGRVLAASSGSAGSGTVTSVTYTGDGVLQSSTPSTAVTTTGTVTATLLAQAKNTVLAGPTTGSNANPTFRALVPADLGITSAISTIVSDVSMASAGVFYDGPTISQGVVGTWFVCGTVTLANAADFDCTLKLNDGVTTFASCVQGMAVTAGDGGNIAVTLAGIATSPAGNLRMSVSSNITGGTIKKNISGQNKDSQIQAFRIG